MKKRTVLVLAVIAVMIVGAGLFVSEMLAIPVQGATPADWNPESFWHRPWGRSGVHHGIDIFARSGTPVVAASSGVVVFSGQLADGGNAVATLGPKWRIHYYAHLGSIGAKWGKFVSRADEIGTVGTTGNAIGKPPHLHYAVITQIPYVWRFRMERFGFDRMFYLDLDGLLSGSVRGGHIIRKGSYSRNDATNATKFRCLKDYRRITGQQAD